MIDRLHRKAREAWHRHACRAILDTPPILPRRDGLVLFSMIGTKVLLPYLVAVKSLHAELGRGRVVLLDDGTLTAADRAALARHLGDPEIRSIRSVDCGPCPRGGTWERLLTLLELRQTDYVIQLDSDTVTLGAVPEVAEAVRRGLPFTLPGDETAEAAGMLVLPEFRMRFHPDGPVDPLSKVHVQKAIEANFDLYPDAASHRYIRGCSGFAGFPAGGPGREAAETFSRAAEAIVGRGRWSEWGTEQVTSNFLIANEPGAVALPARRYMNYWLQPPAPDTCFIHFLGTNRHAGTLYLEASRDAIARLNEPMRLAG
jgi:hypothetical protein